ncbi:deaminase domain-containing protein [Enterococcus sp. LJL51]|uniref:deaminase domain-containing protein n=1 Tax=Enterococcus sp. LJL51 TaxID=3416656 RepID=UPI003CEAC22A
MADVKYTESSWEKMGTTIGTLIGSGWGRGVTDELTDVTKNLEKAESDIDTYDEDGIISFSHTSYTSKYSEIAEKFNVLKTFTSKVNQVLCDEIDDEFYKQIDDYVETMEGLNIDSYTTKNTLGIKEKRIVQVSSSMAEEQLFEKGSISLNDIFNGTNPVSDMMSTEWANYKASNPDTELTYADYKSSAIHSGAFEYESIRDKQNKKELIFNIVSTVVTVAVGFVFPPAGFALGAAFGAYELACAGFGKDFVSGRELGTGERWTRGVFGTIGVVGGVKGLTSFSKNVNLVKGVSDTKTQHIVKMMQNSSRGKYKEITAIAKQKKAFYKIAKDLEAKSIKIEKNMDDFINDYRKSEEYLNLSNTQRKRIEYKFDTIKSSNVATAKVDVPDVKLELKAHSRIHSKDSLGYVEGFSTAMSEEQRLLKSYVKVDDYVRYNDTEAKILEDIASQIKDSKIHGEITLFSKKNCCQSCSNLILEFRRKYPNIKLNVVTSEMIKEFSKI